MDWRKSKPCPECEGGRRPEAGETERIELDWLTSLAARVDREGLKLRAAD